MTTAQLVLTQGARTQQTTTIVSSALPWIIGGVVVALAIYLLTRD